ncbi:MAG: PAS domain S-box protein [bacterium]
MNALPAVLSLVLEKNAVLVGPFVSAAHLIESLLVLGSVFFLVDAAWSAFKLIKVTNRRRAWVLLCFACIVGAALRLVDLHSHIINAPEFAWHFVADILILSVTFLASYGLRWIGPIFLSIQRADRALRESEEKYRFLVENLHDGILVIDRNCICTFTNPAFREIAEQDLTGKDLMSLVPPDQLEIVQNNWRIRQAGGQSTYEIRVKTLSGSEKFILITSSPITSESGDFEGSLAVARDVTEIRRAEKELRKSEERYRNFIQQSTEGIWRFELDSPIPVNLPNEEIARLMLERGYLAECNDAMARMYGYEHAAELAGKRMRDFFTSYEEGLSVLGRNVSNGFGITDLESHELDANGNERIFLNNVVWVSENGFLVRCWGTQRDITEKKRAEDALRESEERYRKFFEDDLSGVYISTPDGKVLDCNPAFVKMFGFGSRSDALNANMSDVYINPVDRINFIETIRSQVRIEAFESNLKRRDGTIMHVIENVIGSFDKDGNLFQLRGYISDITEQRKLQEQLSNTQKIEAIGTLAGGVAHDFNNILTGMLGYADLILETPGLEQTVRSDVLEIRKAIMRASELTSKLLAFSRMQPSQQVAVNLNSVITEMEKLIEKLLGEHITLRFVLAPDLAAIKADPMQMEQILINFAANSRDAMAAGGEFTIKTSNFELTKGFCEKRPGLTPGAGVKLSVSDTGSGMPPDVVEHIFEPFFTTKEVGKGTGLGLASVYGLVKQHNGWIEVESEPGNGTRFDVYFPSIKHEPPVKFSEEELSGPRGKETILLVEDEDIVRALAKRVLENSGYNVITALDGMEAVRTFSENKGKIDLVVMDIVMPNLGGAAAYECIREVDPDVSVLFATGYAKDAEQRRYLDFPGAQIITKPYSPSVLLRKVREMIDDSRGSSSDSGA